YNFDNPAKVSKKAIAFAHSCVDMNTLGELVRASEEVVDKSDCETWGITESGYKWAIQAALYAKVKDSSILDDGRIPV
ncbi:MAG: hypothetical protein PHN61_15510, partial [Methanothrix sp.]|nr:hypothetical protein [Methanothrix sp.]